MSENVVEASPKFCRPSPWYRRIYNNVRWFIRDHIIHPKSSMQKWMEKEIKIACERERGDSGKGKKDWDYGVACYQSAFKAYKSLLKDGHSGFSIGMTKSILNRMIDGKPLTPIEDTPDSWNDISDFDSGNGEYVQYQCSRMSALFKKVYKDGRVEYSDVDQSYSVDVESGATFHGMAQRIVGEMFPITLPYYPTTTPIKAYVGELLTDHKNGDFDSVAIYYLIKPEGDRVEVNRFFKSDEGDKDWVELTKEEYDARKVIADALKASDAAAKAAKDAEKSANADQNAKPFDDGTRMPAGEQSKQD